MSPVCDQLWTQSPSFVMSAGFKREEGMEDILDGPHIGLGQCICLPSEEGGFMEVQCCWTTPGSYEVIITGNRTAVTEEGIFLVRDLVRREVNDIAAALSLEAKDIKAVRPHADLHFHCVKEGKAVQPLYQLAAIYVALVSLLIGRRPRSDTVVFGDVSNLGYLSSIWSWDEERVEFCQRKGIRRVVVGEGTKMSDEVLAMATASGIEVIFEDDMVKALRHAF